MIKLETGVGVTHEQILSTPSPLVFIGVRLLMLSYIYHRKRILHVA